MAQQRQRLDSATGIVPQSGRSVKETSGLMKRYMGALTEQLVWAWDISHYPLGLYSSTSAFIFALRT
jgi:hypothetical protein